MKKITCKMLLVVGLISLALLIHLAAGADPAKDLQQALKDKNTKKVKESAEQIAQTNTEKSYQTLMQAVKGLPPEDTESYWAILNTLASFTDAQVLDKMSDFIISNKNQPIAGEILFALKANRTAAIIPLLTKVLQKGTDAMQQSVIEHLAEIYNKETIEVLINFMKGLGAKDTELRKKAALSLRSITGLDMGSATETWTSWWETNKDKAVNEVIKPKTGSTSNTGTVVDKLDFTRSVIFNRITMIPEDKIIVLSAEEGDCPCGQEHNFDRIQDILTRMKIPHTVVSKKTFDDDKYSINDRWFIGVNCNMFHSHCTEKTRKMGTDKTDLRLVKCIGPEPHAPYAPKLSDKAVKKIADFVADGGYLFTEDWIMEEVLEGAFKGIVSRGEYLPEQVVNILPGRGMVTHPYLKGVFEQISAPAPISGTSGAETVSVKMQSGIGEMKWKIDQDSPAIKVIKSADVTVLMLAPALKVKDAPKEGAPVAITFGYSKAGDRGVISDAGNATYSVSAMRGGRVLHVMSHFGKQKSETDEYPLQNLLINFLTELNERKTAAARKK